MNKDRILILADLFDLLANPKSKPKLGFNMLDTTSSTVPDNSRHDCSTSACIAGWTVAAFDPIARAEILSGWAGMVMRRAAKMLDISESVSDSLFMNSYSATPTDAAKCLREMAETGEVPEWWRNG